MVYHGPAGFGDIFDLELGSGYLDIGFHYGLGSCLNLKTDLGRFCANLDFWF